MKNKIKKLGYGVAIHYNEYVNEFEVYRIGAYRPGNGRQPNVPYVIDKNLKKAVKKYYKKYIKK